VHKRTVGGTSGRPDISHDMDHLNPFSSDTEIEREIDQDARLHTIHSLVGSGLTHEEAERWCELWENEADAADLPRDPDFWDAGVHWIGEERARQGFAP